jgi:hypothetical protein
MAAAGLKGFGELLQGRNVGLTVRRDSPKPLAPEGHWSLFGIMVVVGVALAVFGILTAIGVIDPRAWGSAVN